MLRQLNSLLNLVIGIAVFGAAGFFIYTKYGDQIPYLRSKETKVLTSDEQMALVNKILKNTSKDQLINRAANERIEIEMKAKIQQISKETQERLAKEQANMPLNKQIHKDDSLQNMPNSPNEIINSQVNQRIMDQRQAELDLEEYKRQFKENARRGGFEVELDAKGDVIRAIPIREPSGSDMGDSYQND